MSLVVFFYILDPTLRLQLRLFYLNMYGVLCEAVSC